jgi:hypothetical protein
LKSFNESPAVCLRSALFSPDGGSSAAVGGEGSSLPEMINLFEY